MSRVRVLSANLWNGSADPAGFAALVEEIRPDIVAVQELTPEQAEALAAVMPHGLLEPARDYTGMGIALRQPAEVRRIELPYRDARIVSLDSVDPADGIEVINVHIVAPHSPPPWRTLRVRRAQLLGLEAHLDATPTRRRLVVGDMNSTPLFPVYRRLAARLTDAASHVARRQGRRAQRTWGPGTRAPRLLRIDHAFVSGLAVDSLRVVRVPGSDHSALVVDVIDSDSLPRSSANGGGGLFTV